MEDSAGNLGVSAEVLFVKEEIVSSTSEDLPAEEWSSLIIANPFSSVNPKKKSQEEGLYDPGSGEMCTKYLRMSDSSVFRHPYYNYPAVLDPGIKIALLNPEPERPPYPDDGYDLYMDLCKEHNVYPVNLFYSNLQAPEINLKYYCAGSANVRMMAMALERNNFVKRFDLTDNHLNIDACYHLGQMIKNNTTLEELIMDGCKIREVGLRNLTAYMTSNITIKTFSLARNDLTDDGGELFVRLIAAGASFSRINLRYNSLGMKTATALHEALQIHNNITHLDLSWNPLVHVGSVVKFLKTLAETSETLQELKLSYAGFSSERVAEAIAEVTTIKQLKILDLKGNKLNDECAPILVSNLLNSKLHTYDLSDNEFTPSGACKILLPLTKRKVCLKNLFLDNICVNRTFMGILERVRRLKVRKNFVVTFDKVLHDWIAIGDDPRTLILKRGEYMGKMKKKNPTNVPLFLLSLSYAADHIRAKEVIVMMKDKKIPTNDDWVDGLIKAFPGPLVDKKPTVDSEKMREYIRRLWPDEKLPSDWTPPIMIRVDVKNKKVVKKSDTALPVVKKKGKK